METNSFPLGVVRRHVYCQCYYYSNDDTNVLLVLVLGTTSLRARSASDVNDSPCSPRKHQTWRSWRYAPNQAFNFTPFRTDQFSLGLDTVSFKMHIELAERCDNGSRSANFQIFSAQTNDAQRLVHSPVRSRLEQRPSGRPSLVALDSSSLYVRAEEGEGGGEASRVREREISALRVEQGRNSPGGTRLVVRREKVRKKED